MQMDSTQHPAGITPPFPHGGNVWKLSRERGVNVSGWLDYSANINPLGPPPWTAELLEQTLPLIHHYPDPEVRELTHAVAETQDVADTQVVVGNGSTEILYALRAALRPRRIVAPVPSYADYVSIARDTDLDVLAPGLAEQAGFIPDLQALAGQVRDADLIFLGHPNNPTGVLLAPDAVKDLARMKPGTFFVIDESFIDFTRPGWSLIRERPGNMLILHSLTKFFAVPGLRLGYAVAEESIAERIRRQLPPWSVNTLAQAFGVRALRDHDYAASTRALVDAQRQGLMTELGAWPDVKVYPGAANFLLLRLMAPAASAHALATRLLQRNIMIRVCANMPGLDDRYIRIAVRGGQENRQLLDAMREALNVAT